MSIAQYCAGGLLRWVQHGFKRAKSLGKRKLAALNGDHDERVEQALGLFSFVDQLASDRQLTFGQ